MFKQLSLLPEINRIETEKKVKEALDLARTFIQMGFHPGIMASTTSSYSLIPPTITNDFHSSTENVAVKNIDIEMKRREHVDKVLLAVRRLSKKERELIQVRWFGEDDMTDIETYIDLDMTHATYYRIRGRAFYKLAFALKIERYHHNCLD
ncbi:ArpU family phage packaging/lysis transcriptional regulator [Brevibacillus laterosporus]|uniref:ArpU family phage packaging/lysis transcriptional regulator n=1 Tax=Brevibacillus laterosporus TaxID=1465 RepID=UPI002E20482A|nr:ArpU family phage packaging/lysis transcriptional regulator [Brevibacillus laterosporus]MED1666088.1 ArpU family phage packaging/lysis transcriptional regulator [Brevibacillus laterosporus]MED1670307.1 ArpU family phage packaging/lysis transcriptional regulator [Brevibacillus laterosporus]MED1717898.1 ArpU family phage packaging/lysis transcriptional regulator [Brevibacillus laterosporus]